MSRTQKPILLVITETAGISLKGIYSTIAKRDQAEENIATHMALAAMYYLLFEKDVRIKDVGTFLNLRIPPEHATVTTQNTPYPHMTLTLERLYSCRPPRY